MICKVIPVRSMLSSMLVYLFSNAWVPKICLLKMEQLFWHFFWGLLPEEWEVHLLTWEVLCLLVMDGGLRIQFLMVRRETVTTRHSVRFLLYLDNVWSLLMRAKYGL